MSPTPTTGAASARKKRARRHGPLANLREGARHLAAGVFRSLERAAYGWALRSGRGSKRSREGEEGARLTAGQRRLLEALSDLLLPPSAGSPGAREAGVVPTIERTLEADPSRRALYVSGLESLENWSRRRRGLRFLELSEVDRLELLQQIDRLSSAPSAPESGRLLRKASAILRGVRFPVLQLFPELVRDVMRAFYSSPVAWKWLGYDGPPMPYGYPDLTRRRS